FGGTFLVSTSPIFDKTGELIGTVHIVRDISELKKLREKVVAAERMAALGEMAAKVAHEIRNPMLSIGGFARRLEKRLEGDLKEYSKIIVDEVSRLEGILSDTLSFVKSPPVEKTSFDLGEIIESIITLLEPAILEKRNSLTMDIARPINIHADYDRIKEVLINLV